MTVARALIVLFAALATSGSAAAEPPAVYYRVFLTNGSSLASYGEFARVADRVVFSMPLGGSHTAPALQLVSIPAASVDWAATEQYADAARAALTQADRQLAQARLGLQRIEAQRHQLAAIEAQLEQARAVVADVQSVMADLTIAAPAAGVIMTRMSDAGEVVPAGAPLFTLVDLHRLYLKVYVPESQIGRVRLGVPARVFTDAFPDRPFAATVRYIATRAEFTPKEVQTPDERVKLVYAVRLYLDENPDQRLTPGLPADAIIRCDEEAPWAAPRR